MRIRKRYVVGALLGAAALALATERNRRRKHHYEKGDEVVSKDGRTVGIVDTVVNMTHGVYTYMVRNANTGTLTQLKHNEIRRRSTRGLKN